MDDSLAGVAGAAGAATLAQALADAPPAHGSQCGQDTANHPPSLFEFVHEFISHYIAAEGKLWKSLWGLMARPGYLTQEYLAGRKQRYVLPLRLILTLGLLFFLALKLLPGAGPSVGLEAAMTDAAEPAPAAYAASAPQTKAAQRARQRLAENRAKADEGEGNSNFTLVGPEIAQQLPEAAQARIQRAEAHWRDDPTGSVRAMLATMLGLAPYAVLCSLPFFAGLLKLLYWRQAYGAHFVFALHLHAAWYGMLLLAVLLPWTAVAVALWAWSNLYPVLALKRVHAAGWWATGGRAALLAAMHWIVITLGLLVVTTVGALANA
jgi:hypothetical protein